MKHIFEGYIHNDWGNTPFEEDKIKMGEYYSLPFIFKQKIDNTHKIRVTIERLEE